MDFWKMAIGYTLICLVIFSAGYMWGRLPAKRKYRKITRIRRIKDGKYKKSV